MVEEAQGPQLSSGPMQIPPAVWQLISDALAAGAATLSMTGATAASQPVSLLYPANCPRANVCIAANSCHTQHRD